MLSTVYGRLVSVPSTPSPWLHRPPSRSIPSTKGIDFTSFLTCARFVERCSNLFCNTLEPIKKVLQNSKINKGNVHEIVLVGDSTYIPLIIKLVSDFFNSKEVSNGPSTIQPRQELHPCLHPCLSCGGTPCPLLVRILPKAAYYESNIL
jgi:hypothetical protein